MILNVHEVFDKFVNASTIEEKKQVLLNNQFQHIKEVLKYTFNPNYQFYVEDNFPEDYIKPDTFPGLRVAGIESEIRKAYLFQKGNVTAESLTPQKRKTLLPTTQRRPVRHQNSHQKKSPRLRKWKKSAPHQSNVEETKFEKHEGAKNH